MFRSLCVQLKFWIMDSKLHQAFWACIQNLKTLKIAWTSYRFLIIIVYKEILTCLVASTATSYTHIFLSIATWCTASIFIVIHTSPTVFLFLSFLFSLFPPPPPLSFCYGQDTTLCMAVLELYIALVISVYTELVNSM